MSKFKFMDENAQEGTSVFDAVGLSEEAFDACVAEIEGLSVSKVLEKQRMHLLIQEVDGISSEAKSIWIANLIVQVASRNPFAAMMAALGNGEE